MSHARRKEVAQNYQDSDNDIEPPTKRVGLLYSSIPRYHREFFELGLIGTGEFGSVYKCINKFDGCTYAIKKRTKPVAGSINERNLLNQLNAQAVLGGHQHMVRYYSAWAENNHMIIQNEYCNGGSLAEVIQNLQQKNQKMSEPELRQLLLHVAEGLRYIHSKKLVHMGIKPSSIFICKERRLPGADYDLREEETIEEEITYKIGDLDHVTSINNPKIEIGQLYHAPAEISVKNFTHLPKVDIFALGLTVYEAGGGVSRPKEGHDWIEILGGNLKELPHYSRDLNDLLKLMIHLNSEMRPSAVSLIQHRVLCLQGSKTYAQLQGELYLEKIKNKKLSIQVQQAVKCLKTIVPNVTAIGNTVSNIGGYELRATYSWTSSSTPTTSRIVGK